MRRLRRPLLVAAGTQAELGNLTRFLTYHQHHGDRTRARREYAALSPEARDWSGADLEAARPHALAGSTSPSCCRKLSGTSRNWWSPFSLSPPGRGSG